MLSGGITVVAAHMLGEVVGGSRACHAAAHTSSGPDSAHDCASEPLSIPSESFCSGAPPTPELPLPPPQALPAAVESAQWEAEGA